MLKKPQEGIQDRRMRRGSNYTTANCRGRIAIVPDSSEFHSRSSLNHTTVFMRFEEKRDYVRPIEGRVVVKQHRARREIRGLGVVRSLSNESFRRRFSTRRCRVFKDFVSETWLSCRSRWFVVSLSYRFRQQRKLNGLRRLRESIGYTCQGVGVGSWKCSISVKQSRDVRLRLICEDFRPTVAADAPALVYNKPAYVCRVTFLSSRDGIVNDEAERKVQGEDELNCGTNLHKTISVLLSIVALVYNKPTCVCHVTFLSSRDSRVNDEVKVQGEDDLNRGANLHKTISVLLSIVALVYDKPAYVCRVTFLSSRDSRVNDEAERKVQGEDELNRGANLHKTISVLLSIVALVYNKPACVCHVTFLSSRDSRVNDEAVKVQGEDESNCGTILHKTISVLLSIVALVYNKPAYVCRVTFLSSRDSRVNDEAVKVQGEDESNCGTNLHKTISVLLSIVALVYNKPAYVCRVTFLSTRDGIVNDEAVKKVQGEDELNCGTNLHNTISVLLSIVALVYNKPAYVCRVTSLSSRDGIVNDEAVKVQGEDESNCGTNLHKTISVLLSIVALVYNKPAYVCRVTFLSTRDGIVNDEAVKKVQGEDELNCGTNLHNTISVLLSIVALVYNKPAYVCRVTSLSSRDGIVNDEAVKVQGEDELNCGTNLHKTISVLLSIVALVYNKPACVCHVTFLSSRDSRVNDEAVKKVQGEDELNCGTNLHKTISVLLSIVALVYNKPACVCRVTFLSSRDGIVNDEAVKKVQGEDELNRGANLHKTISVPLSIAM
ncbi:hypothetical protein J6590_075341 [Homalodisca vitripennis]|nr:hypothetical protein J6590_075341 [Homalodisca vitripennis]